MTVRWTVRADRTGERTPLGVRSAQARSEATEAVAGGEFKSFFSVSYSTQRVLFFWLSATQRDLNPALRKTSGGRFLERTPLGVRSAQARSEATEGRDRRILQSTLLQIPMLAFAKFKSKSFFRSKIADQNRWRQRNSRVHTGFWDFLLIHENKFVNLLCLEVVC